MRPTTATPASYLKAFMMLALRNADLDQPTLYHSRIDGMLLPAGDYSIELAPISLSSITARRCA